MREIKFRLWSNWHGGGHEMIYPGGDYGLTLNGEPVFLDWGGGVSELKDTAVMQYTGLKDKHGTEIYGGDVIKQTNLIAPQDSFICEVKWHDGQARYNIFQLQDTVPRSLEVLGNIYENPELCQN